MQNSNASVVELKSAPVQPTSKFRIQMTLDGFPCELEFEGKADALKGIIERLKSIGAITPASTRQATGNNGNTDTPRCNLHNKP